MTIMFFEQFLNEVINHAREDNSNIFFPEIVEKPEGIKEEYDNCDFFDHYYVDQSGNRDKGYYGDIYYPFCGKYLKVGFTC